MKDKGVWTVTDEGIAALAAYPDPEAFIRAVAWVAPPGKDGGVDIVAYNDPLGTRSPRIKVRVKRNANSARIDVMGLRSFMAVLGEGDVGWTTALARACR